MSRALVNTFRLQSRRGVRLESTAVTEHPVSWNAQTASSPVVPFVDGIPTVQARALTPKEKDWKFWSTSNYGKTNISPSIVNVVPAGQKWIIESGGRLAKVAGPGVNILIPGVHKVRAVKNGDGAVMGVVARRCKTRDSEVDAYAVIYTGYADLGKAAFSGASSTDGEVELANFASKALADAVRDAPSKLSASDKDALAGKLAGAIKNKASDLGLDVKLVEIRDLWPSSADIPSRLVALEEPPRAEWDNTHRLKPDYWADYILPEFFTKTKYGNAREPETVATTGLEWNLPSPPEFHHYHNAQPKMTVLPPGAESH